MLKFSPANAKLAKLAETLGFKRSEIYSFDLPAGYSCPYARTCFARADRLSGKITDGPNQTVRCYAASLEAAFSNTRKLRWHNLDALREARTVARMRDLILKSIPAKAQMIRIHSSGDFFSRAYVCAWLQVIRKRPDVWFYAYTKSVPFLQDWFQPLNFYLVYSIGGKADAMIPHGASVARIVASEAEAKARGLEVDTDDSHAATGLSCALVVHGTQPARKEANA